MPPVLVFQLEVFYKVDRLLTGLTAQPKGATAQWYSNKTSLHCNTDQHFIRGIPIANFFTQGFNKNQQASICLVH